MTTKTTAGDTQPAANPAEPTPWWLELVAKGLRDTKQQATPELMRAAIGIAKAMAVIHEPPPKKLTATAEEVCRMLGVGERTFHADLRHRPDFPKPVKLTDAGRVVRWRVADVEAWLAAQATAVETHPEPVQLRAGKLRKKADALLAESQQLRGRVFRAGVEQKSEAAGA